MLPASARRISQRVGEDAQVLDVGGWANPFPRADWVIDLMPYETRGLYADRPPGPERFDQRTWIQRDICDRELWPFENDRFDFAVCSQTLEDVRDPIWVCSELARVARAGYVEVPSRLEEQCRGVNGPWVGWSHHHWLVDEVNGGLEFVLKPHMLHARVDLSFPAWVAAVLRPEERVLALFWDGDFPVSERIFFDPAELDDYLAAPIRTSLTRFGERLPRWRRSRTVRRMASALGRGSQR
jgi:hypothetical protein